MNNYFLCIADEEKRLALENLGVWGQAVARIAGALISAVDNAGKSHIIGK